MSDHQYSRPTLGSYIDADKSLAASEMLAYCGVTLAPDGLVSALNALEECDDLPSALTVLGQHGVFDAFGAQNVREKIGTLWLVHEWSKYRDRKRNFQDEDNTVSRTLLKALGLPTNRFVDVGRDDFLKNPDQYFNQLCLEEFYVSTQGVSPRIRAVQQDKLGVIEFVRKLPSEYEAITIEDSRQHIFSGRCFVYDSGRFLAEIAPDQLSMDKKVVAEIFGDSTASDGLYAGEKSDQRLVSELLKVMDCIPRQENSRLNARTDRIPPYTPNIYEFILAYPDDAHGTRSLRPVFLKVIPSYTGQLGSGAHSLENTIIARIDDNITGRLNDKKLKTHWS